MSAFSSDSGGIRIAVRLLPKSDRDAISGLEVLADGREVLRVRVRAVPSDGEANAALERLIAKSLGVPKSAVAVFAGHKQRLKQVRIDGDARSLTAAMTRLMAGT